MQRTTLLLFLLLLSPVFPGAAAGQDTPPTDVIETEAGDLRISFIGHGTLMFQNGGQVIHVDPVGREGDYDALPAADLILVTHEHGDHLDVEAIR